MSAIELTNGTRQPSRISQRSASVSACMPQCSDRRGEPVARHRRRRWLRGSRPPRGHAGNGGVSAAGGGGQEQRKRQEGAPWKQPGAGREGARADDSHWSQGLRGTTAGGGNFHALDGPSFFPRIASKSVATCRRCDTKSRCETEANSGNGKRERGNESG